MRHVHRRGVEDIEPAQLDLVPLRAALSSGGSRRDPYVGQAGDAEDLAGPHRLQQIAHDEVGCRLDVGRRDADQVLALLHQLARRCLDGEADDDQLRVAPGMCPRGPPRRRASR